MKRDKLIARANEVPLDILAEKVIYDYYIPGVDDVVLIERIKSMIEDKENE